VRYVIIHTIIKTQKYDPILINPPNVNDVRQRFLFLFKNYLNMRVTINSLSIKNPHLLHNVVVLLIVTLCFSCQNKDNKHTHNQSVTLNTLFLEQLQLPTTIVYIGLDIPTDTPTVTVTPKSLAIPSDMILVVGGNVKIGTDEGPPHERPAFWARINPFLMDKNLTTVAQFRKFVMATQYQTEAEKFGNGGIIHPSTNQKWTLKDGASWHHPLGLDFPQAPDNHPVTQVSWNDATAYAQWAGKRLPSEIEWEHAARNACNSRDIYPWGNDIGTPKKIKANIWQGKFPIKNYNEDGFAETSPVGVFGATPLGLNDMSGNVWQWQSNWKFNYEALFRDTRTGDLSNERAQRGGSFLCEPTWCHGYRVSGRSSSTPETSLFHVGFRCVRDVFN
jgi:formylglycine-generating enzyme